MNVIYTVHWSCTGHALVMHWSCTGHALVMLVSWDFEHTYVSVCGASTLLAESECGIYCINILHKFSSLAIIMLYQQVF